MNSKLIGLIVSIVFALGMVGAFYWLWDSSQKTPVSSAVAENLKPIEIESVKKQASGLMTGLQKNSDIPVLMPTEKMGRANPFVKP